MKDYAEKFQQYSIDEAFLVPKPEIQSYEEAAVIAMRIKDEIKRQERITCSVGVALSKIIAKVASKIQKPDGLTVVRPEDVQEFIFPLNVSKIPGIGEKTTEALKLMGITKVEELANYKVQVLNQRFGKMGILMKQRANGIDLEEVEEREGVKSISRHITFDEDTNDPEKITKGVEMLVDGVHVNLTKNRYLFRTVTVVARLSNFSTYTRAKTVLNWTSDINVIKREAMELLSEFIGKQKLRLVGVGVTKLRERDERQTLIIDF